MVKPPSKTVTFSVFLATFIVTALIVWTTFKAKESLQPNPSEASVAKHELAVETKLEYLSPDGKTKLTLNSKSEEEMVKQTISFKSLSNETDEIQIYEKDSSSDDFLVVPYNVFSPDDKYIFLEEKIGVKSEYLVFRTDGKDIRKDEKYVTIVDRFTEKYPDFVITEVTGWGGNGLLVVNTNTIDGSIGPSFWFDLSNFGFIRLTNRFN